MVFDDGDERTLRRSSLCLKGEKHFNVSENLDNLPLTHPEHFGTPVLQHKRGTLYKVLRFHHLLSLAVLTSAFVRLPFCLRFCVPFFLFLSTFVCHCLSVCLSLVNLSLCLSAFVSVSLCLSTFSPSACHFCRPLFLSAVVCLRAVLSAFLCLSVYLSGCPLDFVCVDTVVLVSYRPILSLTACLSVS